MRMRTKVWRALDDGDDGSDGVSFHLLQHGLRMDDLYHQRADPYKMEMQNGVFPSALRDVGDVVQQVEVRGYVTKGAEAQH